MYPANTNFYKTFGSDGNNEGDGHHATWMDIQRVPNQMQVTEQNEKDNSMKKDNRSLWFWKGDSAFPVANDEKYWYDKSFPYVGLTGSRKGLPYAAWVTPGIANNRDENEKNKCLCELRIN